MKFPFDEDKRQIALRKHGFDLRDFKKIFDRLWCHDKKVEIIDGEERRGVIGYLGEILVVGAYTVRQTTWRVITIFRANKEKRAYYEKQTAGPEGKRAKKKSKKKRDAGLAGSRKGPKSVRKDR